MTPEQRDALERLAQVVVRYSRHRNRLVFRCQSCNGVSPNLDSGNYLTPAHVQHTEGCAVMVVGRMLAEEGVEG